MFENLKKNFLKKNNKINDLDSSESNQVIKEIINENYLLKNFYIYCYEEIKIQLNNIAKNQNSKILELGSGAGFLKDYVNVITSEVVAMDGVDLVIDASKIPFDDNALDAIVMMNVLHHVKDPENFLSECDRVLKKDGLIILIEPANTWFSRIIYKNFHHEDFDENAGWKINGDGRLTSANQAIPSIIFERDKKIFRSKFPNLDFNIVKKFKPLHYLLSGGITYKILFNKFFTNFFLFLEKFLIPFNRYLALFMLIKIKKKN